MSSATADAEIFGEVKRHYLDYPDRPYFLSELGKFVQSKKLDIRPDTSLKKRLERTLATQLPIVEDDHVEARVAVALAENESRIRDILQKSSPTAQEVAVDFRRIPFSLLAAFCRVPDRGKHIFFSKKPPFRYVESDVQPDGEFVEIETTYQPEGLRGVDVRSLSDEQRLATHHHIAIWAKDKQLDLKEFYLGPKPRKQSTLSRVSTGVDFTSNLERLINAQEPDLRPKFRIPMDIIELLLRAG